MCWLVVFPASSLMYVCISSSSLDYASNTVTFTKCSRVQIQNLNRTIFLILLSPRVLSITFKVSAHRILYSMFLFPFFRLLPSKMVQLNFYPRLPLQLPKSHSWCLSESLLILLLFWNLVTTCVQSISLWRNSSSEINDQIYRGYEKGNAERTYNEILGG